MNKATTLLLVGCFCLCGGVSLAGQKSKASLQAEQQKLRKQIQKQRALVVAWKQKWRFVQTKLMLLRAKARPKRKGKKLLGDQRLKSLLFGQRGGIIISRGFGGGGPYKASRKGRRPRGSSYAIPMTGLGRVIGKRQKRRRVTAKLRQMSIYGALDRKIVRTVLRWQNFRFRYCYRKELSHKPKLKGDIGILFAITANGRVRKAKITHTTMNDNRVESCLVRRVRLMRFPKSKKGAVIVKAKFTFKPR